MPVCPSCARPFQVPERLAGRDVACPYCRKPVPAPPRVEPVEPPGEEALRLLGSIRTACWTAAGVLIAFLVLAVMAALSGAFAPPPRF